MTTVNVAEAMELINDWSLLTHAVVIAGDEVIPDNRLKEIETKFSTQRVIANECASYYVHCCPRASWIHLANHLYYREFAAVEKLKPFLPLRGKCKVRVLHGSVS